MQFALPVSSACAFFKKKLKIGRLVQTGMTAADEFLTVWNL